MRCACLFAVYCCTFLTEAIEETELALTGSASEESDALKDILKEMKLLRNELKQERQLRLHLQQQLHELQLKMKQDVAAMASRLEQQSGDIERLQNESALGSKVADKSIHDRDTARPRDRHANIGCVNATITLSCPDQRTIWITKAYYGQYFHTCKFSWYTCCPPSPTQDCTELVAENEAAAWDYLKYSCDHKSTCEWLYPGAVINQCQPGYVADYMQIFFDCLPVDTSEPVGFTAHATSTREYYQHETVMFSSMESNFGSHYSARSAAFLCPQHGIYLFSVNFNAYLYYPMTVQLVRDGVYLGEAWAEDHMDREEAYETTYSHASALVVVECDVDQAVWARHGVGEGYLGGGLYFNQFSGYLLYRYE